MARRFLARHPDAIGLDLGAGLDSRALRIAPPPTAEWHDVDFPEVIAARRRLLPEAARPHDLAADVTDPAWPPARSPSTATARSPCGPRSGSPSARTSPASPGSPASTTPASPNAGTPS
ncbi:class I SAM-dependent methyltransferase [Nonomuraea jabiensis]|uniref:class I SAM-dependent methyltransferase n=1 Tax=Nonomuraea jabiensis TaxID=882448 RepID=UPI0028A64B0E|nr:class I SAM-dependent methyltransferase [Nonomuraea jabiensis]